MAQSPNFQETVSFIFTGHKEWTGVNYAINKKNKLSEFREDECTVYFEGPGRNGTIDLRAVSRWSYLPETSMGPGIAALLFEGNGAIFKGRYWESAIKTSEGCNNRCHFYIPISEPQKIRAALDHLQGKFCAPKALATPF